MIEREIVLTIPGTPVPKGSLVCTRGPKHALREDNPATKPWRETVATAARKIQQRADKNQPLDLEVTFTFDRPGSVRRTHPSAKPDVDKLARTILDALEDAGILVNDSQVVDLTTRKRYATDPVMNAVRGYEDALPYPGVRIRINPL